MDGNKLTSAPHESVCTLSNNIERSQWQEWARRVEKM